MREHLRYVAPKRSVIGSWSHTAWSYELIPTRRAICKVVGLAIAKTGVMKTKPLNATAVVQTIIDEEILRKNGHPFSIVDLLVSLLGDIGVAIQRDTDRFGAQHWQQVPWAGEGWFKRSAENWLHSLHMPREAANAGNVAFAESPSKLVADRFTVMKPGRYLTKFFGGRLSEGDIKLWAERYAALFKPAELHFAEGSDSNGKRDWQRVYAEGPQSCMKGSEDVHIYAHEKSVLRLAYMMREKEIISRCIVREDNKEYIRVYPSSDCIENTQLRVALEAAGYGQGTLMGVLLDAHNYEGCDNKYTCPYLDAGNGNGPHLEYIWVERKGYLRVQSRGMDGQTQNGYVSDEPEMRCNDCEDGMDEDDSVYIERHDYHVCSSCADNNYQQAIGRRGDDVLAQEDDCVECETNGTWYLEEYANSNGVYQCEISGNWYTEDDMVTTSRGMVHTDEAVELAVEDSDGNNWAAERDTVTTHDGRVIHKDNATLHTVWFHDDDEVQNDQTPALPQQQVA